MIGNERKGVLVNLTKCNGCKTCQVACKQWNDLPAVSASFRNDLDSAPELTAKNWTYVKAYVKEGETGPRLKFSKFQCFHCHEPACEQACFARAIVKTAEGAVVLQEDLCVGCRDCLVSCPFDLLRTSWDEDTKRVRKCGMCADRLRENWPPACVASCPRGALKYGRREDLIKEAWNLIRKDSRYVGHVYGEKEFGGASWLYISDLPFEELGFKVGVTEKSIPSSTWDVAKHTPWFSIGLGAVLSALFIYSKRRNEVREHEERNRADIYKETVEKPPDKEDI